MLFDPADYAAIGGEADLTRTIEGFKIVPFPYIAALPVLPVSGAYNGDCLFTVTWNESGAIASAEANYMESMRFLEELFPKDKAIFLMCCGGSLVYLCVLYSTSFPTITSLRYWIGANEKGQKILTRHIWQEHLDLAEQLRKTERGKEIYAMRKETIERVRKIRRLTHPLRHKSAMWTQVFSQTRKAALFPGQLARRLNRLWQYAMQKFRRSCSIHILNCVFILACSKKIVNKRSFWYACRMRVRSPAPGLGLIHMMSARGDTTCANII